MYEYLPSFLGEEVAAYPGYRPDTHPGISHVFQSAAFRSVSTLYLQQSGPYHHTRYPNTRAFLLVDSSLPGKKFLGYTENE